MKRPWQISRRALLGGAGTMIGLPLLEAMLPGSKSARADVLPRPKRLVFVVFHTGTPDYPYNGGRPGCFWPGATGADFAMTPILEPLADLKQDILLVNGLHNHAGYVPGNGVLDHHMDEWSILTQSPVPSHGVAGISIDQVAANAFGQYTPGLPSLYVDSVYEPDSYDYYRWVSWSGPTSPRNAITDSATAFEQVYGDATVDDATRARRRAYKKSVLDHAKADADRLQAKLGKADQRTLDEYLTSVRSLEKRVSAANNCGRGTPIKDLGRPERTRQMIDLFALAFQCDRTRVATLMLGHSGQYTNYDWLGPEFVEWNFHDEISHGPERADRHTERLDAYVKVAKWHVEQFGHLVRKLKATPEGDGSGSLFDNTLLVCTSEMSYGHGHSTDRLPVIVAGRGAGSAITFGRYIDVPEQPIANLYLTMANGVGIELPRFGNSTRPLSLT